MGWIGKAAAVAAVVTVSFAGVAAPGSAEAQTNAAVCKRACSNAYSACQRRAINSDTCLRRWLACKKKCSGRPAVTPVPPAPAKR